jgi:hypothetical protein
MRLEGDCSDKVIVEREDHWYMVGAASWAFCVFPYCVPESHVSPLFSFSPSFVDVLGSDTSVTVL